MKKLFTALLIIIFLNSCEKHVIQLENINTKVTNQGIQILTIDSCEYVWCKNGYGAGLTHKGNCKNHKQQQNETKKQN